MAPRVEPRLIEPAGTLPRPFAAPVAPDGGHDPNEATRAIDQVREQAYREGLARAAAEIARERQQLREQVEAAIEGLARLTRQLTERHERALLEIAVAAAERIVRERIDAGDPVAARALRETLEAAPAMKVKLHALVHPDDLEAVRARFEQDIEEGRLEVEVDRHLARGGIVLETPVGRLDASLPVAVEAVRDAVVSAELAT